MYDLPGQSLNASSMVRRYKRGGDDSTERTRLVRLRCESLHWLTLLQADLTTGGLGSMGANILLLTGRQHLHPPPERNHDRGLSRTLQRLRTSTAVWTLSFARGVCNLLTLCTARADSWIIMPTARLDACRCVVTWRASVLTRLSTFSTNTDYEDRRSCNLTENAETPAKCRRPHDGVHEDLQAFLQAWKSAERLHHAGHTFNTAGSDLQLLI